MLLTSPHGTIRSERYQICAPLKYRIRGERVWYSGISQNMSGSGILFEGAAPLKLGTHFEAHLTLAPVVGSKKGTNIRFQGSVVRSHRDGLWAARIFTPRLRHVDAPRPDTKQLEQLNSFASCTLEPARLQQARAERAARLPRPPSAMRGTPVAPRRPRAVAVEALFAMV